MTNKEIAIKWALEMAQQDKLVYSDQFFNPFNDNMRKVIIRTLRKQGIMVWWDTKQGAFIFKENDPRFIHTKVDGYEGGAWQDRTAEPVTVLLPIREIV